MINHLKSIFSEKEVALLGFGREGKSSFHLLRQIFPTKEITIFDENASVRTDSLLADDQNVVFVTGRGCMQGIDAFDIALKSPGIPSNSLPSELGKVKLTSQTDIFLQLYSKHVIGITGTKGKSTTSSLVYHILTNAGRKALFVGNIGIPPFECINEINLETIIVMELSSHQLEYLAHSPHISILLNIFQEHLDHYHSFEDYQQAKLGIARYLKSNDYFIYNADNELLSSLVDQLPNPIYTSIPFSSKPGFQVAMCVENDWVTLKIRNEKIKLYDTSHGQPLKGNHNLYNIMAASAACYLAGVGTNEIETGVQAFSGLEHRIEMVGEYAGIIWYNDSIATIPEAAIEAVKTLQTVDTLILGGFDRGIDYSLLYDFLPVSGIRNIIFIGEAGRRMLGEFTETGKNNLQSFIAANFDDVVAIAHQITRIGKICLLSPAAASYDMFKNFEERGKSFKSKVRELTPSHC